METMTVHQQAVAASMQFEGKKDALGQVQSGDWKLRFTVGASDVPIGLLQAPMGTRYQIVIVEIDDTETPVQRAPEPVEEEDKPKRIMSSAQLAGMLCADELFQSFVQTKSYFSPTQDKGEQTADYVREFCRVKSRAELNTNTQAFQRWCDLNAEYEAWKLCP